MEKRNEDMTMEELQAKKERHDAFFASLNAPTETAEEKRSRRMETEYRCTERGRRFTWACLIVVGFTFVVAVLASFAQNQHDTRHATLEELEARVIELEAAR